MSTSPSTSPSPSSDDKFIGLDLPCTAAEMKLRISSKWENCGNHLVKWCYFMFLGRRRIQGKITGWILIGNTRLFSHFRTVNVMQQYAVHWCSFGPWHFYVMWHETCRITLIYTVIPGHHDTTASSYMLYVYRFGSDKVPFKQLLSESGDFQMILLNSYI